jgi:AAA+ superfamily predicted ATPase
VSLVRVLIVSGQEREDWFSALLARTLAGLPDFHLVGGSCITASHVHPLLKNAPIDAVIIAGDDPSLDELSHQLIERDQRIAVVRLTSSPASPELRIAPGVREFGIGELVDTLRAVTQLAGKSTQDRYLRRSLTESRSWLGIQKTPDFGLLTAARTWLDAVLKERVVREPSHKSDDLRGLSVGRDTIVHLLDQRFDPADSTATETWPAVEAAWRQHDKARLAAMTERLGLTTLERQALLLCLAPEIDPSYQRAFGYLHDDYGRRQPSLGLICTLLGDPVEIRASLAGSSGLCRWRLLEGAAAAGWAMDEPLRVDRAMLGWLLDHNSLLQSDPHLRRALLVGAWCGDLSWLSDHADGRRLALRLASLKPGERVILAGDSAGWRIRSELAVLSAGKEPIRIDVAQLAGLSRGELEDFGIRAARATKLLDFVPILDAVTAAPELLALVQDVVLPELTCASGYPLLVVADNPARSVELLGPVSAVLERTAADVAERADALIHAANAADMPLEAAGARQLARAYSLSEQDAVHAVELAQAMAAGADGEAGIGLTELADACRRIASPNLRNFARRIEPVFELSQVVLPDDQHRQLREIVDQVRNAETVLDRWGFSGQMPYGRGVAALFSGPSGTGKTMAAQAIARTLGAELYHVDLARVVSKYIGETEKNLDAVFSEAERGFAVLLFDEADALFGKRSEVKDAHDRHANIEVAYLLQRVESFAGLAIMTTNFRRNIDQAFLRRFRFALEFPQPDAAAREAIWRQSIPVDAPRADDLDFRFIARRLELSGGNIRQITLRAAFVAAAANEPIAMRHLVEATRAELLKIGMHQAERELSERVA